MRISQIRPFPVVNHAIFGCAVMTYLDRNVGIGMPVVAIAPFGSALVFDENFFIVPGLRRHMRVILFIVLELNIFFLAFVRRGFLVELHQELDDLHRTLFHVLHIEIYLRSHLMLGKLVIFRGIDVGIVHRTAMAARDDDPLACRFLNIVHEIDQNRINALLAMDNGKTMPRAPLTICARSGIHGVAMIHYRRISCAPLAAKEIFRDARQIAFPGIQRPNLVRGRRNRTEIFVVIAVDIFAFAIAPTHLLVFGLLNARATEQ